MLELKDICVSFRSERQDRIFGHTRQQVLFDVSFSVKKGTCLGILGESGSGKSTMGRVLCGLLRPDSGEALLDGIPVYGSRAGRRNLQNKLSVVFQDYTTSANPRFRVKDIIGEGLTVRERREKRRLNRPREIARLLELVGLPADFAGRFPHELSGGQLQRVCIARAVACSPEVILFDEAISSLDAHTQVQIMDLLRELKEKLGLTYVFITHDLSVVKHISNNIAVMYLGQVVEKAEYQELFARPLHPYSQALFSAIPVPSIHDRQKRIVLKGEITSPVNPKPCCRFAARCPYATDLCREQEPELRDMGNNHFVKCHRVEELNK